MKLPQKFKHFITTTISLTLILSSLSGCGNKINPAIDNNSVGSSSDASYQSLILKQ